MSLPALTLVIPVYNEHASSQRLVARIEKVRDQIADPLECILVNDGSDDGTAEELDAIAVEWVRVLHHEENRGYGAALKTGIQAARSPWVAITDADESYPDERIAELFDIARSRDVDMVVGARTGHEVQIPMLRRGPKWVLNKIANWLSGRTIPDINSGFRVMRKEMVDRFIHILPDGFSFTTTVTLAALSSGYRVEYEPIDYFDRTGHSKIRPIYDTLNFLQLVCRTVLWFSPLRIFVPLSLLMFLSAFAVLFGSWLLLGRPMDVTFGVLMMTGVMVMAVGMLADMIAKRMN